jgi:formyl-CoA transferase
MVESDTSEQLPLADVKIVDCASLGAGPYAATWLGDFGAEVIKIEYPDGGDNLRYFGPDNVVWTWAGRNKQSLALDLHDPDGRDAIKELVEDADVFLENFRPGRLEEWGLGWETLSEINPELVMVRTTGFGQTGPYKDKPGFGTLAEAMSGFAAVTGQEDGPPTLPASMLGDSVSALFSTIGILVGLYWRDAKDGTGQYIDSSILEPMIAIFADHFVKYDIEGLLHKRMGSRQPGNPSRNVYKTADKEWVAVSPGGAAIIERLLRVVGGDKAVSDPRFATSQARRDHIDELEALIQDWIGRHDLEEVLDTFEKAEAAIAPVYHMDDIAEDPHLEARNAMVEIEDDEFGDVRMPGVFPKLSKTPGEVRSTGPSLGEHTEKILLRETSLNADEIRELEERGALHTGGNGE